MLNRFFSTGALQVLFVFLWVFVLAGLPKVAHSQQCVAPYETITRFEKPDPGAAMVWQTFYNQYGTIARERQARFVSSYGLDNGNALVVGQVQLMKNVRPSLILVEFNDRGRTEWEKIHKIPNMKDIVKIVPDGEGSLALLNMETQKGHRYFWLGFFDKEGGLKSSKTINDDKFELLVNDIHPSIDNEGWVVPVTVIRKWGGDSSLSQKNAAIYILNKGGDKVAMRSYILGVKTELTHVGYQEFDGGAKGYIATGYFENDSHKKIAWVMRLNPDLSVIWQKEYGRGISAKLVKATDDKKGNVFIVGDVNSAESDVTGAWLAKLDGVYGNIQWQRYYASKKNDYSYNARNVAHHADGRISFLMQGKVIEKKKTKKMANEEVARKGNDKGQFGHLLTLSPRGLIMSGDAYYAGFGSYVSDMSTDSFGRLVLVGNSWQKSYANIIRQREKDDSGVVPLRDDGEIHLPDVQLSDKTRQGLALLKKKISAQDVIKGNHDKEHGHKKHGEAENESAIFSDEPIELLQKGWVFAPEMDRTYKDPCG